MSLAKGFINFYNNLSKSSQNTVITIPACWRKIYGSIINYSQGSVNKILCVVCKCLISLSAKITQMELFFSFLSCRQIYHSHPKYGEGNVFSLLVSSHPGRVLHFHPIIFPLVPCPFWGVPSARRGTLVPCGGTPLLWYPPPPARTGLGYWPCFLISKVSKLAGLKDTKLPLQEIFRYLRRCVGLKLDCLQSLNLNVLKIWATVLETYFCSIVVV